MFRLRAVLAALLLGAPLAANAAEVTRIASSFDEDDPFDLILDVRFKRAQTHTKIVREQLTGPSGLVERPEVWHKGSDTRLDVNLAIGLYKDFEFSFGMPIVLQQNDAYSFVSVTNNDTSTVVHNCLNPNGTLRDPTCLSTGVGELSLFTIPSTHKRGGLGNMHFGMAYAFFNQERDDTKPMWLVGIDYEAPTAKVRDPSQDNTGTEKGNVGDKVHKYTVYTSFSRRMGVADPYFKVQYTIPVQGPGIYSNCFNLASQGLAQNCFKGPWSRKETGIQAPSVAGFITGAEFTAFSDKTKAQRFALDIRLLGNYVGEGRYYNELSAALGKLLATQEYFQVGGQFGATASAGEAFTLRASGMFLYNTDHTLTNEALGVKPSEINTLGSGGQIDPANNPNINPNFDFRTDLVSRRFRAVESTSFRLDLSAAFAF